MAKEQFPIDITNINEKVYTLIRNRIIYVEYAPGEKINSRMLQEELGVSQTPIKDALSRLAGEGMVEISSRRGTFVKDVTEKDIFEIEGIRIILETAAVEAIAEQITDAQVGELEGLYRDTLIDQDNFDYGIFMEKDFRFHQEIIRLTGNQRLLNIYTQLNAHVQIVRFQLVRKRTKPLPWANNDHLSILNALKERDVEKAKAAIREHRIKSRDAYLQKNEEASLW